MEIEMTNKNEIAGVPALALRQFFFSCDETFRVAHLAAALHLKGDQITSVLDALIVDGYVGIANDAGLDITSKAQLLIEQVGFRPITREASYNVVLNVLRRIDVVNSSAKTAHRISGAKVLTEVLNDEDDQVPFVEIEIGIRPIANDGGTIQKGLEQLAADYAYDNDVLHQSGGDNHHRSIDFIRNQLLNVDPHAVLRFTVE